jgi:hypothetical protein
MRLAPQLLLLIALPLSACASQTVQTAGTTARTNIGGAVSAPLTDFNLVRSQIPIVLREAAADPYARPQPDGCGTLAVELTRLDDALGPDIDIKKKPTTRSDRGATYVAKSAVAAVKDVAEGWIPMKSWVRYMSGAEAHSAAVQGAISAGQVRRAYLKGLAQSEACPDIGPRRMTLYPAPPVTPSSVAQ